MEHISMTDAPIAPAAAISPAAALFGFSESENTHSVRMGELIQHSKPMGASPRLISLIRGVYTKNARLILLIATYTVDMTDSSLNQKDVLKQFMNEYLRWLDAEAVALFHNYANYLPANMPLERPLHPATHFAAPVENLKNHIAFIDNASGILRTLSICEPLAAILKSLSGILADFDAATRQQRLENIDFGCVQSFESDSSTAPEALSSFFNTLQILHRTEYSQIELCLQTPKKTFECSAELALLDLTGANTINALAVLKVVDDPYYLRSLLFPPFRIGEFSLKRVEASTGTVYLERSPVADDSMHITVSLTFGSSALMDRWQSHLRLIFPSDLPSPQAFVLPTSFSDESMPSIGLGINMHDTSTQPSNLSLGDNSPSSIATQDTIFGVALIKSMLPLSQLQQRAQQLKGAAISGAHAMLSESLHFGSRVRSASPVPLHRSKTTSGTCANSNHASETSVKPQSRKASGGDEQVSLRKSQGSTDGESSFYKTKPVHIDVANFGKSYEPSFSLVNLSEVVSSQKGSAQKGSAHGKKKGFFSFFKRKQSKKTSPTLPQLLPIIKEEPRPIGGDADSIMSSLDACDHDDGVVFTGSRIHESLSQPSGVCSTVRSVTTVPSAFALPESTSMTFFKQHVSSSSLSLLSLKQGDASSAKAEPVLVVDDELKAAINSDDSIDYYISSATPRSMKVSRWKEKYGKWEMLTVNERLFLKIVINHNLQKCWLLVFKEEFDEDLQEEYDAPVVILDVDISSLDARRTSALDIQICAKNALTTDTNLILIRCGTGSLTSTILQNLTKATECVAVGKPTRPLITLQSEISLVSSFMSGSLRDHLSSLGNGEHLPASSKQPSSTIMEESTLTSMQVRLLKLLLQSDIHDPASWEILAMYILDLCVVSDVTDNSHYFKFAFTPMEGQDAAVKPHSWIIPLSERNEKLSQIGKAGLLVELDATELFMIECRGTKEFQELYGCL